MTTRRLLALLAVVAGAQGAGAAVVAGPAGAVARTGAVAPDRAQLTGFACHSTRAPTGRTVSVTSVMRPVPGTRVLSVKFSLAERVPGATGLRSLGRTGDLGRWLGPSDPTLGRRANDVWKLAKTVSDVDAPAAYQFSVDFRWQGVGGRVIATATRATALCHERELRPDLLVRRVVVHPSAHHPRRARYVAVIANRGATATGAFAVVFTPGTGAAAKRAEVASLRPGATLRVPFTGPACQAASPPTVAADPAGQVDDYDRSNNSLTVACPPDQGD